MSIQTTEGTGPGSAADVYPKIINDVVKSENILNVESLGGNSLENSTSDIVISTADGVNGDVDAPNITIEAGAGYPAASDNVDADGGSISIIGGAANGEGEGGDVNITAGNTGDGPDANAGNVNIRGGNADNADNSDAGSVNIYGGDASDGTGDSDGGSILLQAGDAGDDGQAGDVTIRAGNSGNGNGSEDDPEAGNVIISAGNSESLTDTDGGDITITCGNGTAEGSGGDLILQAGNSVGSGRGGNLNLYAGTNTDSGKTGYIIFNSMPIMPVFVNASDRNTNAPDPINGMFCYNSATGNMEIYVGGAWKSVNTSAIV